MKPSIDTSSIARLRRRLSLDYHDLTNDLQTAHSDGGLPTRATMSRCLFKLRRQFLPHYFLQPPPWRIWIRGILKDRALPDFCVIGPAKSGTSDLAVTLMSHPNVMYPLVKEYPSRDPLAWRPFYPTANAVHRHARRFGVALCPLVCPYLHHLDVAAALSALRPNIKIVIILRNPTDLVFSLWKWTILHMDPHFVDRVPFLATFPAYVDKALELFPEVSMTAALHYGIYATSVAHWLRHFGQCNVRILDIGDYFRDRAQFLHLLESFVGLPHVPPPPHLSVVNRNPLSGTTPHPDSLRKLNAFFQPYNERLWQVIGARYAW